MAEFYPRGLPLPALSPSEVAPQAGKVLGKSEI